MEVRSKVPIYVSKPINWLSDRLIGQPVDELTE